MDFLVGVGKTRGTLCVGTEVNEVESNWSSTVKKSNAPIRCYDLHMTVSQKYKRKD